MVNCMTGFQMKTASRTAWIAATAGSLNNVPFCGIPFAAKRRSSMTISNLEASMTADGELSGKPFEGSGVFNVIGLSAKFFVSGAATLVLYSTDSWIPLYYILSSVLNGVLSKGIKSIVKQPRPPQSVKAGYGMPSSHTQAFFFFVAVVAVNAPRFLSMKFSALLSLLLLLYSVVASYWRVVAGVHSYSQTIVGAFLGLVIGILAAKGEVSAIAKVLPFLGKNLGVPIYAKLTVSILGFIVICKSEVESILEAIGKASKNNRNSDEI